MSKLTGSKDYGRGSAMSAEQTQKGIDEIKSYTGKAVAGVSPYQGVGTEALDMYKNMVLGGDMSQFKTSPGYQFRLGEGVKALEQGASARGDLLSGSQAKALTQYGQDYGSQEYGNYLGQVGGLASQGLQASGMAGNYYSGAGSSIGQMYGQLGQTQAQMASMQGQAKGNLMGDVLGTAGFGLGSYLGRK